MKKYTFLFGVGLACLLIYACKKTFVVRNYWDENNIKIDGKSPDWKQPFLYDPESKFYYKTSNDDKNFYLCIKIMEDKSQIKILKYGLTVWFDTTGKQKTKIGVKFPIEQEVRKSLKQQMNEEEEPEQNKGSANKSNKSESTKPMRKKMVEEQREMELIGFSALAKYSEKKENKVIVGLKNKMKIDVGLGFDSLDALIYEMSIPLSDLYKNPTALLADSNKILGLVMKSGYLGMNPPPEDKNSATTSGGQTGLPSSRPNGMGGAGGGQGGPNGGAPPPLPGGGVTNNMIEQITMTIKVKMAVKK
jgi:hypothetical protein